jgi:hypothetical protein
MGQAITVTRQPGALPEVMRFELNRSLTGMAIERYSASPAGERPPDVLARRLFDLGATHVTIYSNVVTITAPAERWRDIADRAEETITNLFIHYNGDTPAPEPTPESAPEASAE